MKPLIAISPQIVHQEGKKDVLGCYRTYLDAIEKAGGTPLVLNFGQKPTPTFLSRFDGILLTGGDDLHPKYLGLRKNKRIPLTLSPNERSEYELLLAARTFRKKIPTLGLCLGAQVMNVALGGTIFQDLQTEFPEAKNHKKGSHEILLVRGSLLRKILRKPRVKVNSRHHQANRHAGKGLIVSAVSKDGVVEAIEAPKHPFFLGLQWHPEESLANNSSQKIFRAFVKRCHAPTSNS